MIEVELKMPDGSKTETLFNPADGSVTIEAMDDEDDNDRQVGEDDRKDADDDRG